MRVINKNRVETQEAEQIDPRFGARIREARKERGLTIKELADKVGCSATHITRIELGQRRIDSMALMIAFADTLHLQVEELLTLAGQSLQGIESYLRLAFPSIKKDYQEKAISDFATLITGADLTEDELWQILLNVRMAAEFYLNHRPNKGNTD